MGGCRCSYKNCQNTTKTTENLHFFHYPVKHKERCKIWIENAGKPFFCDLEEDQLRNKVICENHFEDKWFPNSQKKRLLQGAVPALDAGCGPPLEESVEPEMYVSNGLQEIQILPASSDGSLFILDTDSMFNRSQKVESFVYKNGMIIPASQTPLKQDIKSKLVVSKPSTSNMNIVQQSLSSFNPHNNEVDDPLEFKFNIKKETPDYDTHPMRISRKNEDELENISNENYIESSNLIRKKPQSKSPVNKQPIERAHLAKNYLRKIKQHSKDIASIKKMLRQKTISNSEPDMDTIMNSLKDELPSTLFTVLSLNISNKFKLTEEDENFFTTIHKMSPQVYQLLVDKYKWNMPHIDTSIE